MTAKANCGDRWKEDQQASRAGAGRHTLGSDHDSPRPPAAGQSAVDSAVQLAAAHRESMTHPIWWRSAGERARGVEGEFGRVLRQLVDHVELGWPSVASLQIATEAIPVDRRTVEKPLAKLAAFILREFVGAFRRCAFAATVLVPGTVAPIDGVPSMDEAAEVFDRYLNVLHLAAADPSVPAGLAETIRAATSVLADWAPEFAALGTASALEHAKAADHAPG